jgi:hypothetical protein
MIKKGSVNLDRVEGIHTDKIFEKKEQYMEMIKSIKESGIDLDKIIETILFDFRIKTEANTKAFAKIAKNNNEKQKLNFIKEFIAPRWVLVENSEDNVGDIRTFLDNKKFLTYLMGIFVTIHSKNLVDKIHELTSYVVAEMFYMTMIEVRKTFVDKEG